MNGPMATSEVTDTSLFADYSPAPGHYDEMFRAPGAIRPHWIQLAQQFDIAGHDQIAAAGSRRSVRFATTALPTMRMAMSPAIRVPGNLMRSRSSFPPRSGGKSPRHSPSGPR